MDRVLWQGHGDKPGDHAWRRFQPDVSRAFQGICGYCEEYCNGNGEVDHFRPKSRFPERVYQWTNWILACHFCNSTKREHWPLMGYVDPCANAPADFPEAHFDFDTETTMIVPKGSLSGVRRRRALQMIDDLALNSVHHLKMRKDWLKLAIMALEPGDPVEREQVFEFLASRERALSSITRKMLEEKGIGYNRREE